MMPGWVVTSHHDWVNWIDVFYDGKAWRFYSGSFWDPPNKLKNPVEKLKEPIEYGGVTLTSFRPRTEGAKLHDSRSTAKFEDVSEFMKAIMLALL